MLTLSGVLNLSPVSISFGVHTPVHGAKYGSVLELSVVLTLNWGLRGADFLPSLGPLPGAEPETWEREPPPTPPPPEKESSALPLSRCPHLPSLCPVSSAFLGTAAYYSACVFVGLVEKSLL